MLGVGGVGVGGVMLPGSLGGAGLVGAAKVLTERPTLELKEVVGASSFMVGVTTKLKGLITSQSSVVVLTLSNMLKVSSLVVMVEVFTVLALMQNIPALNSIPIFVSCFAINCTLLSALTVE